MTATELILIRHGPPVTDGRLCGRTDVPADLSDADHLAAVRTALGAPARLVVSPALRCRQTARSLWNIEAAEDARLWEQDFGAWDGLPYGALPDLGPMAPDVLAAYRPPGGESFADLCARIHPALLDIAREGPATIVAHAGTVRAALALALGTMGGALAFDIAPLSATHLVALPSGWQVKRVNWSPAP